MTTVVGARVDLTTYEAAAAQILGWSRVGQSRAVWIANTHVLMEAFDDASFRASMRDADLVTPDGMPLVWVLRMKGHRLPNRVYGPTLMRLVVEAAARECIPVGLYGAAPAVLELLCARLAAEHPDLRLTYSYSPPFRELGAMEDEEIIRRINESATRILFVGLGCPKQERWMAAHRGRIHAVMLGVGAAFDFFAGTKKQAPPWMQRMGLEWLFRLSQEPRRLWKRYLFNNPRFAVLAAAELLGIWRPRV